MGTMLIISVIVKNGNNPWLLGIGPATTVVQKELWQMDTVREIYESASVATMFITLVVSGRYPQYFLIKRGALQKGKDSKYLVSVREESFTGVDSDVVRTIVMRAAASVIFEVGRRCSYALVDLQEWFSSIPGHDRIVMSHHVGDHKPQ